MSVPLAIVNGPNLNQLGKREKHIYGTQSWREIWENLENWAASQKIRLHYFQSNHEGALIDHLQKLNEEVAGVVMNPGAYAHTSIALRDCVAVLDIPLVEVHLSKLSKRETFRQHSYIAEVAEADIIGFGTEGYLLGLELIRLMTSQH